MDKLKIARQNYPQHSLFITATGSVVAPLKVTKLSYAKHEDRKAEIDKIKAEVLLTWREMNPTKPKDFFKKLFKPINLFETNADFNNEVKEKMVMLEYLSSLESDIIEEEGGVIYCGETKMWAKNV